jgi:hypothetical protein
VLSVCCITLFICYYLMDVDITVFRFRGSPRSSREDDLDVTIPTASSRQVSLFVSKCRLSTCSHLFPLHLLLHPHSIILPLPKAMVLELHDWLILLSMHDCLPAIGKLFLVCRPIPTASSRQVCLFVSKCRLSTCSHLFPLHLLLHPHSIILPLPKAMVLELHDWLILLSMHDCLPAIG